MRGAVKLARRSLTIVGILCLGAWAAVTVVSRTAGARNNARLDRLVSERRVAAAGDPREARAGEAPIAGELLGRIEIPRANVSAVILEGIEEKWLLQAAGHLPGTALPGEAGNAALAGHRDSFFRGLRKVRLDDTIVVTTPTKTRRYVVESIRLVPPEDTRVLAPTNHDQLTLVTCYPFGYIGPAPKRFVVLARGL